LRWLCCPFTLLLPPSTICLHRSPSLPSPGCRLFGVLLSWFRS
jgi:hypothetical protein